MLQAVNPGWVCAVCATLVKIPGEAVTCRACVQGRELIASPTTIAAALGIGPEEDYDYPIRSDHAAVSYETIVTTISDGR